MQTVCICKTEAPSCSEGDPIADDVVKPKIAGLKGDRPKIEFLLSRIGKLKIGVDAPFRSGRKIETQIGDVRLKGARKLGLPLLHLVKKTIVIAAEKMKFETIAEPGLNL